MQAIAIRWRPLLGFFCYSDGIGFTHVVFSGRLEASPTRVISLISLGSFESCTSLNQEYPERMHGFVKKHFTQARIRTKNAFGLGALAFSLRRMEVICS